MIRRVLLWVVALGVALAAVAFGWWQSRHEAFPEVPSLVATPLPASPLPAALRPTLSEILTGYRAEHGVASVSAAIGLRGELVFAEAHGYADLAAAAPATPESLYRIGSVSKSITAVAMGRLMEAGRMDIDRSFRDYVPSFPEKTWSFTPRQLASHTAGIRHYRPGFVASLTEQYHDEHYATVVDSLKLFADDPLLFEPGSAYTYSSYGFNALSAAMVAAAKMPFRELLQREVFDPAGMQEAQAEDVRNPHPRSVGYYLLRRGENYRAPDTDNSYKIAGGGIIATPSELVAFGNALLGGELVTLETRRALFTPTPLADYGLGFQNDQRKVDGTSFSEVGHGGASVGGATAFVMYPELALVIAVASNVSPLDPGVTPRAPAHAVADELIRWLSGS